MKEKVIKVKELLERQLREIEISSDLVFNNIENPNLKVTLKGNTFYIQEGNFNLLYFNINAVEDIEIDTINNCTDINIKANSGNTIKVTIFE